MRGEDSITNKGFLNHNTAQIGEHLGFNSMASAGILSDGYASLSNPIGDLHFHLASEFTAKVTANISPILLREFRESDSQLSSGSVKKSGGQSSSFEFFALRSFFSSAAVAL